MSNKAVKIAVTVVVLAVALAGLLRADAAEGTEYYKHVDEVMVDPGAWQGKHLQLHGYVVRDSILRKRDSLEYRFKVTDKVGDDAASSPATTPASCRTRSPTTPRSC